MSPLLQNLPPHELESIDKLPPHLKSSKPQSDWTVTDVAFAWSQATGRPFVPLHELAVDKAAYDAHWRHCGGHGWLPLFLSFDVAAVVSPRLYEPPLRREVAKLLRGEIYWCACSDEDLDRTLQALGEPVQAAVLPPPVVVPQAWEIVPDLKANDTYRHAVLKMLEIAHGLGASDIFLDDDGWRIEVRFRLSGIAEVFPPVRKTHRAGFLASVKKLAGINPNEKYKPHDDRFQAKLANGTTLDIRIAFSPTHTGETVGMRLQDSQKLIASATKIPLPENLIAPFKTALAVKGGMVLVTGPTGSGKTTTLYCSLLSLDRADLVIRTVEDPVEYTLPGITQVPVGGKTNLTFHAVLRSFLRLNPDVILVGEIRDPETAGMALEAALTGHTLLSTLHAPDATETITRYIDLVPHSRVTLAAALSVVLAQRLASRLCQKCRVKVPISDEERHLYERFRMKPPSHVHRRYGCPECGTGLRGRVPLFELVIITAALRDIIAAERGWSSKDFRKQWMSEGGQLMGAYALELASHGIIEVSEAKKNMVYIPELPPAGPP